MTQRLYLKMLTKYKQKHNTQHSTEIEKIIHSDIVVMFTLFDIKSKQGWRRGSYVKFFPSQKNMKLRKQKWNVFLI